MKIIPICLRIKKHSFDWQRAQQRTIRHRFNIINYPCNCILYTNLISNTLHNIYYKLLLHVSNIECGRLDGDTRFITVYSVQGKSHVNAISTYIACPVNICFFFPLGRHRVNQDLKDVLGPRKWTLKWLTHAVLPN